MAVRITSWRWRNYSSSLSSVCDFLKRTEYLGIASGSSRDGQHYRCFAKEAVAPKAATPNAAKAAKAKNTTKKEEKREQRTRFNELIDSCLNAPPPVKALKEKEKLRLLEREKLGVVSHERLREIEQEKAREKAAKLAAKKKAKEEAKAKPALVDEEVDVEQPVVPTVTEAETGAELTAEEGKRLAKISSRMLLIEARERAYGESVRLQLKKDAIAALPPHLREAAMVPDLTPFPKNRIPASLTPPIPGYVEERAHAAAHAVTVKKSR